MKSLLKYITEKQVINFGSANSNYGQCIIFAGGPGSGKGFVKDSKVLANFKTIDVDELKKMYIKLQKAGKLRDEVNGKHFDKDEHEYDMRNTEDTGALHNKVKERGWKHKQRTAFWNEKHKHMEKTGKQNEHLPNILWDMVSDNVDDMREIIDMAKPLGYQITLVWVVCNIDTARQNNQTRDRRVDDSVIVKGHEGVRKTMFELFGNKHQDIADNIDRAWIAYSAGYGRMLTGEYLKSPVVKIKKNNDGKFIFDMKNDIVKFLDEQMPEDPDWDEKMEKERKRKERNNAEKEKHAKWQKEFMRKKNAEQNVHYMESLIERNETMFDTLIDMIDNEILHANV